MSRSDFVALRDVHFAYDSAAPPVLAGLTLRLPRGWTGVVGPNGGGKTTLLALATGALEPTQGIVLAPHPAILCAQRTDTPPMGLADLLAAHGAAAARLRDTLGVTRDATDRWETLSFGERKRAQIAVALWQEPELLALDEPTNHVDAQTRALLERALRAHRGVGLLVSHDRALLDALCERCLFLDPPDATLRPGGWSQGAEEAARERRSAEAAREHARRDRDRLAAEAARRREEADRADRKRSKRGLARHDSDGRARIDLARVSGKDGAAGRRLRQLDGRRAASEAALEAALVRKEHALGIWIAGERTRRDAVLRREAGRIALGSTRQLHVPELVVAPDDRVAITGPNGAGKSTLVSSLVAQANVPPERLTWLPQETSAADARAAIAAVRRLSGPELGRVMTAVSCLGSRPERLLATAEPSPGELRKLLLSLGLARAPHLVVMDEPTNHLDLPSIECLEAALASCPCALVLVSHDARFLARLARREWRLEPEPGGDVRLHAGSLGHGAGALA